MGKWLRCSARRTKINRYRIYGWNWKRIADIYGVSTKTVIQWSISYPSACMRGKAPTLLRDLFFLTLVALLTGCTNGGGVALLDGFKMPGTAIKYIPVKE